MTDQPDDTATPAPAKPTRQGPFRRKFTAVRLSPESAERQSRVALLAWKVLGGDGAQAFLNSHDEALGGRPLDLAVASADGCAAVEAAINARAPAL